MVQSMRVRELIKRTPPDHIDRSALDQAISLVEEQVHHINQQKRYVICEILITDQLLVTVQDYG